jgi:hypothetical protein
VEEAAGKSEVNPVPGRAEERAVAGRAAYLTNIVAAATKNNRGCRSFDDSKSWFNSGHPCIRVTYLLVNTKMTRGLVLAGY